MGSTSTRLIVSGLPGEKRPPSSLLETLASLTWSQRGISVDCLSHQLHQGQSRISDTPNYLCVVSGSKIHICPHSDATKTGANIVSVQHFLEHIYDYRSVLTNFDKASQPVKAHLLTMAMITGKYDPGNIQHIIL